MKPNMHNKWPVFDSWGFNINLTWHHPYKQNMFVFWLSTVSCWLSSAPSLVRCNLIWFSNSLDVSTFTLEQYYKPSFNTKSILVSIPKPTNNRKLYNKANTMCPIIHVGCGCFWWFIVDKINENLINSLEHWMKMVFFETSIFSTYFNWIPLLPWSNCKNIHNLLIFNVLCGLKWNLYEFINYKFHFAPVSPSFAFYVKLTPESCPKYCIKNVYKIGIFVRIMILQYVV